MPQDRSGQVGKISAPPEFDPRTVHTVAIRYTAYATQPTRTGEGSGELITIRWPLSVDVIQQTSSDKFYVHEKLHQGRTKAKQILNNQESLIT